MAIIFDNKGAAGLESFKVLQELAQVRVKGTEDVGKISSTCASAHSEKPRTASGLVAAVGQSEQQWIASTVRDGR